MEIIKGDTMKRYMFVKKGQSEFVAVGHKWAFGVIQKQKQVKPL